MEPQLSEETREILRGLRAFAHSEVFPRHEKAAAVLDDPRRRYDADGRECDDVVEMRRDIRMASARAGYYHMFVPEDLGGGGLGPVAMYAAWEDLHHLCGGRHWLGYETIAHWVTGPSYILSGTSDAVRASVLPGLLSGEKTSCFAMSEPDAGSDVWRLATRATHADGVWRITGVKQWITNGEQADFALVFAVTDPQLAAERRGGISAFLVPTASPGFHVDSVIRLYGQPGGREAIISLEDVAVSEAHVVGTIGAGLDVGLAGISLGRLFNAAKSVGLARWALELAVAYAKDRVTFGRPLIENQAISFGLADSATEILAAHLLGLHCAGLLERGERAVKEASMAKAYSTEMAFRVIDQMMQVHGGMGLTNEMGLAEAWHEVRTVRIADGSAEMMRRLIAHRLAKGDLDL